MYRNGATLGCALSASPCGTETAPAHRPLRRHTMHNPRPLWWAQAQAPHYRPTNSPPRWTQAGSAASSRRWVAVNQPTGDRKCKAQMTCLNSSSKKGSPFLKSGLFILALPVLGGPGVNTGPEGWGTFLGNFLFKGGSEHLPEWFLHL